MPPLFFDPERVEIVEIPDTSNEPQQSLEKILPLAQLLVTQEFPYTHRDFPRIRITEWSEEYTADVGARVAKELEQLDPPVTFTQEIATRLNVLGVFPPTRYFFELKKFGGFAAFKKHIGVDPYLDRHDSSRTQEYDQLLMHDFADLLVTRYSTLVELPYNRRYDGPLTQSIIDWMARMNLSPSRAYIEQRFGGIRAINEHLGYPDIHTWDNHDYVAYGATILRHNGPNALNFKNIQLLSANRYGPQFQTITTRFDWQQYKFLANEEFERQTLADEKHRQAVYDHYTHLGPPDADIKNTDFSQMARHRALYLLATRYLNGQTPDFPSTITNELVSATIETVLKKYPRLTPADIETAAVAMDIFDDLWPMNHPQRLPILANCKRK